jgi:hypothetical protein
MIKITSTIDGANVVAQFDTIEEYIAYEEHNNKEATESVDSLRNHHEKSPKPVY